jgi:cell wall-associated NlpC family hydrolase
LNAARGTYLAVVAVTAAVVMNFAGSAHADPVEDVERQLDAKWSSLENTIEQYNKTSEELKKTKVDTEAASQRVKPLQDKVNAAYAQVGLLSSAAYRGGRVSTANALLGGGSTNTMLEQLTLLGAISTTEQRQINELKALKTPLEAEKNRLQTLLDAQQKMEAELSTKKVAITKDMDALQEQRMLALNDRASRSGLRTQIPKLPYIPGAPGKAIAFALAQIGKPYVWNAAGPDSYDCSGLTMAAWAEGGVSLSHFTGWQRDAATPVGRADLQPGDLVFFGSGVPHHVGLYIGGGNMVHAPQAGDSVKISNIDKFGESPYFGRPKFNR